MAAYASCDLFAKRRGVVSEVAPSQSAMVRAWAPEEDASLSEEYVKDLISHAGGGRD